MKFINNGKHRGLVVLFLSAMVAVVAGCATTVPQPDPGDVGVNFWIKRTTFDPSSAHYVEIRNQGLARETFAAHRRMMLEHFPDMDKYIFDFTRLKNDVLWRDKETAQVRIHGVAVLFNPDGTFRESTDVDDTLFMIYENDEWKIQFAPRWSRGIEANRS